MYLYIVIFLSILHGLWLTYFSEARTVGTAYPRREVLTASNKIATFDDVKMLSEFLERATSFLNRRETVFTADSDCTTELCRNNQKRQKRSAFSDSSNAQTKQKTNVESNAKQRDEGKGNAKQKDEGKSNAKQKDEGKSNAKHKQTLISQITPYAFGNPSLPDKSKKGNKRPKPKKGRG